MMSLSLSLLLLLLLLSLLLLLPGLRGAVAFACANIFPDLHGNRKLVIGTTTAIILITVFVFGVFTVPMIAFLNIPSNVDAAAYLSEMDGDVAAGD